MEKEFNEIPIKKLVLKLGIPAMAAQFFNILYSVTDRIFVGNIRGIGEIALASVGVSAPALTIIAGFAALVGVGGMSLMSISIGKKEYVTAQKAINNALLLLMIQGIALTAGTLAVRKPLLLLLGCNDSMYFYANTYFSIYLLGTISVMIGTGMNYFVLGQGYAKDGMIAVILGAVLNIVLDPILIFVCDMGIAGAAVATVIAQTASMGYVLFVLTKKSNIQIKKGGYEGNIVKQIYKVGSMSFLIVLLDNGILILLNTVLRKYGGENGTLYISCATVVQSFMVLAYFPAAGIASGCGTLYSYHYGAFHFEKLMEVFKNVLKLCFVYLLLLTLLAQAAPNLFVNLFVSDIQTRQIATSFVRMYTLGLVGTAVQYAFVDGLTSMGKVKYAIPISLFRKCIYIVGVLLLPLFLDVKYVFWSGTLADCIGATFTLIVFRVVIYPRLKLEMKHS